MLRELALVRFLFRLSDTVEVLLSSLSKNGQSGTASNLQVRFSSIRQLIRLPAPARDINDLSTLEFVRLRIQEDSSCSSSGGNELHLLRRVRLTHVGNPRAIGTNLEVLHPDILAFSR